VNVREIIVQEIKSLMMKNKFNILNTVNPINYFYHPIIAEKHSTNRKIPIYNFVLKW
jgi:hypothetical protein